MSNVHREADRVAEERKGADAIGTTLQGIGPSYASKMLRFGLRMGDLVDWKLFLEKYNKFVEVAAVNFGVEGFDKAKELDQLRILQERMVQEKMIVDSVDFMHRAMQDSS